MPLFDKIHELYAYSSFCSGVTLGWELWTCLSLPNSLYRPSTTLSLVRSVLPLRKTVQFAWPNSSILVIHNRFQSLASSISLSASTFSDQQQWEVPISISSFSRFKRKWNLDCLLVSECRALWSLPSEFPPIFHRLFRFFYPCYHFFLLSYFFSYILKQLLSSSVNFQMSALISIILSTICSNLFNLSSASSIPGMTWLKSSWLF